MINEAKKSSREREIGFSKKDKCHKYDIMSVLALALTLTHFDITVNKTSCFRSKITKKNT